MKVAGTHLQAALPDPSCLPESAIQEDWTKKKKKKEEDWTVRRNRGSEILLTKVINWITFSKEQMGTCNQNLCREPDLAIVETYPEKITSNILQPGLCTQTGWGRDSFSLFTPVTWTGVSSLGASPPCTLGQ